MTNVNARLSTITAMMPRVSMLTRLPMTRVAPKRPKIAPDAPAVAEFNGDSRYASTPPPSALEHIEREEPVMAQPPLQRRTDHPQRPHVEQDVGDAVMHERRGEDAPPLPVATAGGHSTSCRSRPRDAIWRTNMTTFTAISE